MSDRLAVYRFYDAGDALLYVGVTKNFGLRWQRHASAKPWWPEVQRQTVDWYDEAEALRVEVEAIEREKPLHNVATTNTHYRARRNYQSATAQPLMGSAEIGRALKVGRQRVQQITTGPGFPQPYDVLTAGRVWRTADFEAWAKADGRLIDD